MKQVGDMMAADEEVEIDEVGLINSIVHGTGTQ